MSENKNPIPEKKTPWFLGRAAVMGGLILVGPFALPMLWFSGAFKIQTKIIFTLAAVVLTYLCWHYTGMLFDKLSSQLQEFQPTGK